MIIDNTYFSYKPVFIPNAVQVQSMGQTSTSSNIVDLNEFIDVKEIELLLNCLGYEQLTELLSQFNSDGSWIDTPLQKWVDLVDGKEQWRGLRYTIGTSKISLIAYYVFFHYLGNDWKSYSTTGIQMANAENSNTSAPNDKQVAAWNKFVLMYNSDVSPVFRPTFFQNWNGTGMMWGGNPIGNDVSLYKFLTDNNTVYDTSFFIYQHPLNPLGL